MNILLIHQYAGNKGDRAVVFAICRLIKHIDPDCEITISTSSPELWEHERYYQDNNISFIPYSWNFSEECKHWYWSILRRFRKYTFTLLRNIFMFFGKSYFARFFINPVFLRHLRYADKVISVGGHHFTTLLSRDIVSSVNYDAMSTLTQSKELACFSQTFGPFHFVNNRNCYLTRKILASCSHLFVRDSTSVNELQRLGVPNDNIKETFESVLSLNSLIKDYSEPSKRLKRVGISIYATQKRTDSEHISYVKTFSHICDYLANQGYEVCFFPMEIRGTEPDDRPLIREILSHVKIEGRCFIYDDDLTTEDHLAEVSRCRFYIGHKTHSCIFALLTGTPLLGLAYHPKTLCFMQQFECSEFCINDCDFNVNDVIDIISSMENDLDQIGYRLFTKAQYYSSVIEHDFQTILKF